MAQPRVLFIRAVNVGGATLPMAEFRELLSGLGAADVRTYIASGNALVTISGDADAFDRAVESALTAAYGWSREVMSRTREQLVGALAEHPFEVVDPRYSYISFLSARPTAAAIEKGQEVATGADRWKVIGDHLHLRYAHGIGASELNTDGLMRRLAVPGTARNLNTVRKLVELSH